MSQRQPSPDQPARAWRPSDPEKPAIAKSAANPRSSGSARYRKIFLLLATIVALCGAILAWLLLPQSFNEPKFLALPITEYRAPSLPVAGTAAQDSVLLQQHFPNSSKAFNFQERHQLEAVLNGLRQEKPAALVVYLGARAVQRDGQVFILPGDALPDQPETWLPLARVLQCLRQCDCPNRLLILDLMQPVAKPFQNVLDPAIAEHVHLALEKELGQENEPSLRVLCACGPGQTSLVPARGGHSVFAHYLNEGLFGEAAGYKRKRKDGYVSVEDLAAYVADQVDLWANRHRNVSQRPVLLGKGPDFYLTVPGRNQGPTRSAKPQLED